MLKSATPTDKATGRRRSYKVLGLALILLAFALALSVGASAFGSASSGWVTQSSGTTSYLCGVCFVDASHGWVVGAAGVILLTPDGGATWAVQSSGTSKRLNDVSFIDISHGWAVGEDGTILATSNGGVTWSTQKSGTTSWLSAVTFSDASHGWVVGRDGTILATTDGGARWVAQDTRSIDYLQDVSFVDASHGWAVGYAGDSMDRGVIYSTSNGGAHWGYQAPRTPQGLHGVCFVDASHGWAVGDVGSSGASGVIATTDGGATWTEQKKLGRSGNLEDVSFSDATHGWAVGGAGTILTTSDGGTTWNTQRVDSQAPQYSGVVFADASHGWVVGSSGTILATSDGGGPLPSPTPIPTPSPTPIPTPSPTRTSTPGTPTAKTPQGTISTTTPTFKWSKAKGAAKYELRVYEGTTQVLRKTGITKVSWKSTEPLPQNVDLTWKVRAADAAGAGAWSKSRAFEVAAGDSAKAITAFSFQGLAPPVIGVITEAAHTIALTVPNGTGVSALVPTITATGVSVSPASGVANDFTNPVTYTVTAADGTSQGYVVTVAVAAAPLAIGDPYQGGIIAYILQPGDPGYVAGQTHGLIAATADQTGSGIYWSIFDYQDISVPGGTSGAFGTGSANTTKIIAQNGTGTTYAAGLARAHRGGGYHDWYLPSKDELNKLYLNQAAIGGFADSCYWSSTQCSAYSAWIQDLPSGYQAYDSKCGVSYHVRAVRAF